jgi:hypothetical protein
MIIDRYFKGLNTPLIQIIFLGLICLCCPGMFNALSGLGAGGSMSSNVGLTDAANGALYGCFAVVGFFAGSVTNTLGVNATLTVSVSKINVIHNNSNNDYFFFSLLLSLAGVDWLCYLFFCILGIRP